MVAMREAAVEWVLIREHSFSIVEEEGFNLLMKEGCLNDKELARPLTRMIALPYMKERRPTPSRGIY